MSNNEMEENATDSPHSLYAFCMFSICPNFHGKPRLSVVCQFYFILLRSIACIVKAGIPPANQLSWSHWIRINSSSNGDIGSYHMHQHSSRPKIYHSRAHSLARLDYRTCENVPKNNSISHLWFVCGWHEKRQTGKGFVHFITSFIFTHPALENKCSLTHTHSFTPDHSFTAHSISQNKFQAHFH